MYLYNSATHKKEEFVPNDPKLVKMYTCGPTVYHFAHIGNLRSYIMEDVLEKYLRYAGYDGQARHEHHRRGPPDLRRRRRARTRCSRAPAASTRRVMEIAKFYTDAFFDDCAQAQHQAPRRRPARDRLHRRVYQDHHEAAGKGLCLSWRAATCTLTPPSSSATISSTTTTRRTWPWASARAWRRTRTSATRTTSCSGSPSPSLRIRRSSGTPPGASAIPAGTSSAPASRMKYLGEDLDIHCGGIDNAFPHHTNEIAQSESLPRPPLVQLLDACACT